MLQKAGFYLLGSRQLRASGELVYVRFSNIRDACVFFQNAHLGGPDWIINHISAREFTQVSVEYFGGISCTG